MTKRFCAFGFIIIANQSTFIPASALAKSDGVAGHSGKVQQLTCATGSCHDDAQTITNVAITGSETAEVDETITLELSLGDVPASNGTGVGIAASGGVLAPIAATPELSTSGPELIHSRPRSTNSATWTFTWRAPADGVYTIYAATIVGDDNGAASGDHFGQTTFSIAVGDAIGTPINDLGNNAVVSGTNNGGEPAEAVIFGGCQSGAPISSSGSTVVFAFFTLLGVARSCGRRSSVAIISLLTSLLLTGAAIAAKRITFSIYVEGTNAQRIRSHLRKSLKPYYREVSSRRLAYACSKMGRPLQRVSLASCARLAGVDAVVIARVEKNSVTLSILSPTIGAVIAKQSFSSKEARDTEELSRFARRSIGQLNPLSASPMSRRKRAQFSARENQHTSSSTNRSRRARDRSKHVSSLSEKLVDTVTQGATESPSTAKDLVSVSLSLGISARNLKISAQSPGTSSRYDGSAYPEIIISAQTFPLRLVTETIARDLGLQISLAQDIAATSKALNDGDEIDTTSRELLVDLTMEWRWNERATTPRILFIVGWGMRDFEVEENKAVTSLNYRFFRFGARAVVPIGTPLFALSGAFDVRPVYGAGREVLRSLGSRHGGGFAWAIRPGVYGRTSFGLFYLANFEYVDFRTSYAGLIESEPRENTADRATPSDASDAFVRFWVGAGFAL